MAHIHQMVMNWLIALSVILSLVSGACLPQGSTPNGSLASVPPAAAALQQFSSGGHILGVLSSGLYIASTRHALHIDFAGANPVQPQSTAGKEAQPASEQVISKQVTPLGTVTWPNLWDGITLTYQAVSSGIAESVYTLAPGAAVAAIRLRYNVPAALAADGSLDLSFDGGRMTESAPLAWQEIGGQRVAVEVAFNLNPGSAQDEIGFSLGRYDPAYAVTIDPSLTWVSHLGDFTRDSDYGRGVAVDASGNIFVVGDSEIPWGAPVRSFTKGSSSTYPDVFVVKLDTDGALQWSTFLGGPGNDEGNGIGLDAGGNIFVAGTSTQTWGAPVQPISNSYDAFVARLNPGTGALVWNTFMGSNGNDFGTALTVNGGSLAVAGTSDATWGNPVQAFTGGVDSFVARLNPSTGAVLYNTFMGGSAADRIHGIAMDSSANVTVIGTSEATWGLPKLVFSSGQEAFVARLNFLGGLQWNTFLGGSGGDDGKAIALDASGNAYVTGTSDATWGTPMRAHSGWWDGFAAKLNTAGGLVWNTFLGTSGGEGGYGIAVNGGYVVVVGQSQGSWGSANHTLTGFYDLFAAQLNATSGELGWTTFWGGMSSDTALAAAFDPSGYLVVAGYSYTTWGNPLRLYSGGGEDATIMKFSASGMLLWNTFMGSAADDFALDLALDSGGNIYVTGYGNNNWGSPVSNFHFKNDATVARLNASTGALTWLAFLGSDENDYAFSIAVDPSGSGKVYVVGQSFATWGTPAPPFTAGSDGFIAALNAATGAVLWNGFFGGSGSDVLYGVTVDNGGNVYAAGSSTATWGSPSHAYTGATDGLALKLNSSDVLVWNTFLGGSGGDAIKGLALNSSATSLNIVGNSSATWGATPVRNYTAGTDVFVARLLPSTGGLAWNTFLGGAASDTANAIAVDTANKLYVAGSSGGTWGSPIRGHSANLDGFVAHLDASGNLIWNTFLGGPGTDYATDLTLDNGGGVLVTGYSGETWGVPAAGFNGNGDTFVARLYTSGGGLCWNTFVGGTGGDDAGGIAVDANGIYTSGYSFAAWGNSNWTGDGWDGFVARINPRLTTLLPMIRR